MPCPWVLFGWWRLAADSWRCLKDWTLHTPQKAVKPGWLFSVYHTRQGGLEVGVGGKGELPPYLSDGVRGSRSGTPVGLQRLCIPVGWGCPALLICPVLCHRLHTQAHVRGCIGRRTRSSSSSSKSRNSRRRRRRGGRRTKEKQKTTRSCMQAWNQSSVLPRIHLLCTHVVCMHAAQQVVDVELELLMQLQDNGGRSAPMNMTSMWVEGCLPCGLQLVRVVCHVGLGLFAMWV